MGSAHPGRHKYCDLQEGHSTLQDSRTPNRPSFHRFGLADEVSESIPPAANHGRRIQYGRGDRSVGEPAHEYWSV